MSVTLNAGSVVAKAGQQVGVASLLNVTAGGNPAYVVVSLLDRNEYTASSNNNTGTLSGNGHTATFSSIGGDSETVGLVFTYNAATGQYTNATYGNLSSLTYTASTNTNDNTSISIFTTNNSGVATQYANNPYDLQILSTAAYGGYTSYVGSVSVVTQPSFAGPAPSQATPDSISAAAMSFVGKAWNDNGCWVLASNISAEAGASLPITSTSLGIPGVASGEWIVAYNGPAGQSGNWQSQITAGEMVVFETSATSGHITTVASGSGSSAMLVDNITYVYSNGSIANSANDGSANDIIVAAPHLASQEWAMAVPGSVVVYELDCPVISVKTASSAVAAGRTETLAPLFSAANPLASQVITQYQFYDTGTGGAAGDSFMVGGTDDIGHSAAGAVTVSAAGLASVSLLAGASSGTDTVEVRAYNGQYWGDWQSLTVNVTGTAVPPSAPSVTGPTATQTWKLGQAVNFTLAANTFTDPQAESLTYGATLASGAALPAWLTFNAATRTFTGTVANSAMGLSLKVTATDSSGLSTSETFSVLTPAPAAPTVTAQTATQTWKLGQAVNFTLAANTFTDPQGESLTYAATLANGAALPSWLHFNAATDTFSGTVPVTAAGLSLKVTATDTGGAAASEIFSVVTPASAPILTAPTGTLVWKQGSVVSIALASNTFTDPQGETLSYTATLANGSPLPSWLHFNAATETFTGAVPVNTAGLSIKVTATDTTGLAASEVFSVLTPGAPVLTAQTANQTWTKGQAVNFKLAANTFTDPQGQPLSYMALQSNGTALPHWLQFNAATETFTGTAPATASTLNLEVVAIDPNSHYASETFSVSIVSVASQFAHAIAALTSNTGSGTSGITPPAGSSPPTLASPLH